MLAEKHSRFAAFTATVCCFVILSSMQFPLQRLSCCVTRVEYFTRIIAAQGRRNKGGVIHARSLSQPLFLSLPSDELETCLSFANILLTHLVLALITL